MKLVAVTSCPTGIAHTYMAAEAIEQAAKAAGHEISVETQGAAGATPIAPEVIGAADAVIFAADVEVRGRERFAGKPTITASVKRGISGAAELVTEAEQRAAAVAGPPQLDAIGAIEDAERAQVGGISLAGGSGLTSKVEAGAGFGTKLRQWLMTGVSYMIPFVAAGGILIALSFLFGGASVATKVNGGTFEGHTYTAITDPTKILSQVGFAGVLFFIGSTAFKMLIPILAGFIAFAMADPSGTRARDRGRLACRGRRLRLPRRPARWPDRGLGDACDPEDPGPTRARGRDAGRDHSARHDVDRRRDHDRRDRQADCLRAVGAD
jgi:PTS system fructose-specific IIC component